MAVSDPITNSTWVSPTEAEAPDALPSVVIDTY